MSELERDALRPGPEEAPLTRHDELREEGWDAAACARDEALGEPLVDDLTSSPLAGEVARRIAPARLAHLGFVHARGAGEPGHGMYYARVEHGGRANVRGLPSHEGGRERLSGTVARELAARCLEALAPHDLSPALFDGWWESQRERGERAGLPDPPRPWSDLPPLPTLCARCYGPQRAGPVGPLCAAGHGGAGLDPVRNEEIDVSA